MGSPFILPKKLLQAYLLASTAILPYCIHDVFNQNAKEMKLQNNYNTCVTAMKSNDCTIDKRDELNAKILKNKDFELQAVTFSGTMFLISGVGLYAGRREKLSKEKQKSDITKIAEAKETRNKQRIEKRKKLQKKGFDT